MKVYVLVLSYPYEGGYVLGVYSTSSAADMAMNSYIKSRDHVCGDFEIYETTVDGLPNQEISV